MSGSIRKRRLLAAITGLWLVAFTVLGERHESRVAHVTDARTGSVFHAAAMVGDHTGHQSDVHGADPAANHDSCAIAQTLHQAASPSGAFVHVASAPEPTLALGSLAVASTLARRHVYRIAPKTSPPAAA